MRHHTFANTSLLNSSFPQDLKDIIPIVPDQTETERKPFWKGGSGRVLSTSTVKHLSTVKGKLRCHALLSPTPAWQSLLYVCVKLGKGQRLRESNCGCVLLGSAHIGVSNLKLTKTSCHTLTSSTFLPWSGLNYLTILKFSLHDFMLRNSLKPAYI